MFVQKTFHFYSAHRNERLRDKCRQIHGHEYKITLIFSEERNPHAPDVTILFSSIDELIKEIKDDMDHHFLIHDQDPLLKYLEKYEEETGDNLGLTEMPLVTSVENLCYLMFQRIIDSEWPLHELWIQETSSSTIKYNKEAYQKDQESFEQMMKTLDECDGSAGYTARGLCLTCGRTQWDHKVAKRQKGQQ